jgi:hypothetical protein
MTRSGGRRAVDRHRVDLLTLAETDDQHLPRLETRRAE